MSRLPASEVRAPYRALAVATGLWLACAAAAAACPQPAHPAPTFAYAGADLYTPQAFSTVAAGSGALASCGIPGARGHANDVATMSLDLSMMDGYELVLDIRSDCDSTLLVNAADGSWAFDDDSGEGVMPRIAIADPWRLNGQLDIWIGTYGGGSCPATITLQTRVAPGMPDEAGDVPMGVAGCPNPGLNGQILTYTGGQLWSRQSLATVAAGATALSGCNLSGTRGYANAAPTYTFYLSGMEGYRLDLTANASCDSTMLVHAADGSWHFDDDGNGNLDPAISLDQARQTNGRVDVWLGSYGGGSCAATLNLETFHAAAPVPVPQPQPQPAVGCPNPNLTGQAVSYSGAQLWSRQSLPVQASGSTQLANCGIAGTRGYANPAPSYSFYLSGMAGYRLDLTADASCDSTMLVRTSDGQWHFNDDGHGNLEPLVSLTPPTALEGRVDVWVGTYGPTPCAATLNLETFAAASMPAPPPPPQQPGAPVGNGHFELVIVPEGITFEGARVRAMQMGGHLATINSAQELQAAFAVANNPAAWSLELGRYLIGPWLGGYRQGNQWMWVTGEPWNFTSWAPGQPDNHGGRETHLNFWVHGTSPAPLLNDADPNAPLRGFVLER